QLPLLVKFGPGYSNIAGLTFDGWDVDKRILSDLDWDTWKAVATELQADLTDSAIESAVRLLPEAYYAKDGARLVAGMTRRRDAPGPHARRFYESINQSVDVFCSDASEHVDAHRFDNGDLELDVTAEGDSAPYFHRRFEASTTNDIRVYLYGGNDKVVV